MLNAMILEQTTTAYASTIEAIAYGLMDGGVQVVTGYPGFHAHEIVAAVGGVNSVNERTAYSVAWGAALAGRRSAVVLKNVGLNDAADPFVNSMNLRTKAGLVVVVLDDVEVAGSQCRQDSRHLFDLSPGLWFEPVSAAHAYDCALNSSRISEELNVPVVIRLTNQTLRSVEKFRRKQRSQKPPIFRRDSVSCVAHPVNVHTHRVTNGERAEHIARFVETQYTPPSRGVTRTIAVGASLPSSYCDSFHVWTYPLPAKALRIALQRTDTIDVFEAGGCFATEKMQAICSTRVVQNNDASASIDHSNSFRFSNQFESLFSAIRSFENRIVVGDLGSFTMDTNRTIDACLCYGASVATAIGCSVSGTESNVFCVTGDAAFLHSGKIAMEEAVARGVKMTIVLIDNGGAASTGGQPVPAVVDFPGANCVVRVNHEVTSLSAYRMVLDQLTGKSGVTVLHVMVSAKAKEEE